MPLPPIASIDPAQNYAIEGATLIEMIRVGRSVELMRGVQGISVQHADGGILIGLGGLQDPNNANNAASLTWTTVALNVCNGNNTATIYVVAGISTA